MARSCAVAYLARGAEITSSFERFVESYQRNLSGHEHDLVVIWKGRSLEGDSSCAAFHSLFNRFASKVICLPDEGVDITAYAHAAKELWHESVCFFNSHTEINAPNWLHHMMKANSEQSVGIVGGSGSFESLSDGWKVVSKISWLRDQGVYLDKSFYRHWSPIVGKEIFRKRAPDRSAASLLRRMRGLRRNYDPTLDIEFEKYWVGVTSPYSEFPSFPNPHIRTNGFLINRDLFLQCLEAGVPETKFEAYAFESGPRGLTRQLRDRGLRALIVNNEGATFDVEDWKTSETFRIGDQRKLLFKDNQTRAFDAMKRHKRRRVARMTWGADPIFESVNSIIEMPSADAIWQKQKLASQIAIQTKRLFGF